MRGNSASFRFEPLAAGAFAAIAPPGSPGVCNSGFVDLDGGGVVFDTSLTPSTGRELLAGCTERLGRPPSMAAVSHWHLDHSLGLPAFPGIPTWGTRRTREVILEKRDELTRELDRHALEKDIRQLEAQRDTTPPGGARETLEFVLLINRALLAAGSEVEVTPPSHTFDSRLVLPGSRHAELRSFGAGHTEADAILHLPRDGILYAGDLVALGIEPSMGSGDPVHWLAVLDEIERLQPEQIVPGHGPVTDIEGMSEVRGYVGGVLEAAERPEGAALPAAIRRWEGSISLRENIDFARRWLGSRNAGP